MKRSFRLSGILYRGKSYGPGSLFIDSESKKIEIEYQKGFIRKHQVRLLEFDGNTSRPLIKDAKVILGDANVFLGSPDDSKAFEMLVARPNVEGILKEVEESIRRFFLSRASALVLRRAVGLNPREALLAFAEDVPDGRDPLEIMISNSDAGLTRAIDEMNATLEARLKEVPPEVSNRIYAMIYAVGLFQDSIDNRDDARRKEVIAFLTKVSPGKYLETESANIGVENAAVELLKSAFDSFSVP